MSTNSRQPDTEPSRQLIQAALVGYNTAVAQAVGCGEKGSTVHLAGIQVAARVAYTAGRRATARDALLDFTGGYSRSGQIIDPDHVDQALAAIAEHATRRFREFRTAMSTDEYDDVQYPAGALNYLLAVVAGIRAAFGLRPTMTGQEILAQMEAEDVTTPTHDTLRMHLFARHGNLAALGLTDREAHDGHEHEHDGPCTIRDHDRALLDWSEDRVRAMLADIPEDEGHDEFARQADDVARRLTTVGGAVDG